MTVPVPAEPAAKQSGRQTSRLNPYMHALHLVAGRGQLRVGGLVDHVDERVVDGRRPHRRQHLDRAGMSCTHSIASATSYGPPGSPRGVGEVEGDPVRHAGLLGVRPRRGQRDHVQVDAVDRHLREPGASADRRPALAAADVGDPRARRPAVPPARAVAAPTSRAARAAAPAGCRRPAPPTAPARTPPRPPRARTGRRPRSPAAAGTRPGQYGRTARSTAHCRGPAAGPRARAAARTGRRRGRGSRRRPAAPATPGCTAARCRPGRPAPRRWPGRRPAAPHTSRARRRATTAAASPICTVCWNSRSDSAPARSCRTSAATS